MAAKEWCGPRRMTASPRVFRESFEERTLLGSRQLSVLDAPIKSPMRGSHLLQIRTTPSTNRICRTVRHRIRISSGFATARTTAFARDIATFNRFKLNKNSIPRGASSADDVVIE